MFVPVPVPAPRAPEQAFDTTVTPRVQPSLERRRFWERRYLTRLRLTDTTIVLATVALTALGPMLIWAPGILVRDPWLLARVPLLTAVIWVAVLSLLGTRSASVMGTGAIEYKRVAHATGLSFGLLAIVFVVFQWQGLRTQLILAMPVGLVALLAGRWAWRRWLVRQRKFGHYASRALIVGARDDVEYVIERLQKDGLLGYVVVGATTDDGLGDLVAAGRTHAVVGTMNTVAAVARELGADTIIVASQPTGDPDYIRRLSWQLEGTAAELVLSSRLTDVAGPRVSFRPIDGLPLIHVRIPDFEGGRHLLKRALDVLVSGLALLVIAPLLPIVALAIKMDSRGPVFFRQVRVGRDGREFSMVKFRSMRTSTEQELHTLKALNEGSGPLFKMKADPRVTRVGRFLRRHSVDELPQFWNVFIGDMSIVGPRPPLPSEVTAYDGTVFRRLYIKPGITGLWQISGRNDVSYRRRVALDVAYIRSRSVKLDMRILMMTAPSVLRSRGSY